MGRWTGQETEALLLIRQRLGSLILDRPQYPEVVGDRKLIRFLRGHNHDIEKALQMISDFLVWRNNNNVDSIRENIINNGMDHPSRFPFASKILPHLPQLVISKEAEDRNHCPIMIEQYNFSPSELMSSVTLEEYIVFCIYCLEYRSLIVEQLSEDRERSFLASLTEQERSSIENDQSRTYGEIVQTCVIRDLEGVGLSHFSTQGQEIIRTVIALASNNYPEIMRKCHVINAPWVFSTLWFFIKGLLPTKTIEKVSVAGTNFLPELTVDIDLSYLPDMIRGGCYNSLKDSEYSPYPFDKLYLNSSYGDSLPKLPLQPSDSTSTESDEN